MIDIIDANLSNIASPPARILSLQYYKLTHTEIQVANFIRNGKRTKEIAEILGVATSTVDYHRHNIRRKLGLGGRKENLSAYLANLI